MLLNSKYKNEITRYTSFMLVIGFFYSCSSSNKTIKEEPLEDILTSTENQLKLYPTIADLHIKKGETLIDLGYSATIDSRALFYDKAIKSYSTANSLGISNFQSQYIQESINKAWLFEINSGIEIFENYSSDESLLVAEHNFDNAILLNKTEPHGYLYKSKIQFKIHEVDMAIETLNIALTKVTSIPNKLYEYLGFLHLQNSNTEQAIYYYKLAHKNPKLNKNISFALVNIYILNQQHDKAIELLRDLDLEFPNDANIKNVLGTQLFYITENILNHISDAYVANDFSKVDALKSEAIKFLKQAEKQLINSYKIESSNQDYIQSLAVFYNNLTRQYLSLAEISPNKDALFYTNNAQILLESAIKYFEILASVIPGDFQISSNIKTLKQVHFNRYSENKQ